MAEEMNVDDLASDIVDSTLDTIGSQTDDQGIQDLYDSVPINPATWRANVPIGSDPPPNNYTVVRVGFKTPFDGIPTVTLGQASAPAGESFVVVPYVQSWTYTNGMVDGFMLGIYTLVAPPVGLSLHYITWRAIGKASRSGQQGTEQSWTDTYDPSADFLEADASDVADQGEDLLDDPPEGDFSA